MRHARQMRTSTAQQVGKAPDSIEIGMKKESPVRRGFSRKELPETNANVLAQVFRRSKPRIDRVRFFSDNGLLGHEDRFMQQRFSSGKHMLVYRNGSRKSQENTRKM